VEILENVQLAKFTTMKIGGEVKKLLFPENNLELLESVQRLENKKYVISNGSNLLINDKKTFDVVVHLKKLNCKIESLGNGKYRVGASVRIQTLINHIHHDGYGGIEFLFSVPGYVGASVAMNAGRGRPHNQNIADFVTGVEYLCENKIHFESASECKFNYRYSKFKYTDDIITSVDFQFYEMSNEMSTKLKKERIQHASKTQDRFGGYFGSVFAINDWRIMHLIRLLHPGFKNGVGYSKKTSNWMINRGNGTYKQTIFLLNLVVFLHKLLFRPIRIEVNIWK
jgi:UDP-N-acetylmuramate dehydrogenase